MNKNKILIVVPSLDVGGGAERIAAEVGSNLNKRGYRATFFTVYDDKVKYDYEGEYVSLERSRSSLPLSFSMDILRFAREIAKICKKKNIDTVLSFMFMANMSAVLSRVLFRNNAKVIVSVRNNPLETDKNTQLQMKWLYPKADKVVALSKGVEYILKQSLDLNNTTYIHNVQNIDKFKKLALKNVAKEHEGIFDDDFVFITIGSLTEQKAHWYLLRCFKKVTLAHEHSKFVVLGDGILKNKLNELAKKMGIENNVFFLGNVENVFPHLKKSDCFIFTSLWEGFGNVLTEALSQDLPVISTDCVAGPREILCPELEIDENIKYPYHGKYGILTKTFEHRMFFKTIEEEPLSEDEIMFADVMIEMMEDKELRRKYSNGSERAENFDVSKIIDEWDALI